MNPPGRHGEGGGWEVRGAQGREGEQGMLGAGGGLIWRNGDSGVTLSLPATPERRLQPLGVRPLTPGKQRQYEDTVSSCTRRGLGWTLGGISSQISHWNGLPRGYWSPWRC